MIIPKKIKIGNLTYDVSFHDDITLNSCDRSVAVIYKKLD